MTDLSHLNALKVRLSNERVYLSRAKKAGEKALRKVWIAQIEKEIAQELEFLNITEKQIDAEIDNMSDDDLLAALAL